VTKAATQSFKRELDTFRRHEGGLRMSEALHLGVPHEHVVFLMLRCGCPCGVAEEESATPAHSLRGSQATTIGQQGTLDHRE
jgi:hypothetical protein